MSAGLTRRGSSSALIRRMVALPALPRVVASLPLLAFATLVRRVGIEDVGWILPLASNEQLVAAFDEDLFVGAPGDRERLDPHRLAVWLEVLLEAGDEAAAARFVELSQDFVVHVLTSMLWVFEEDTLRERLGDEDDDEAASADKALESALVEELDGYVLVAREPEGWDAVLSLVLALDRDHRGSLERWLDRAVRISSPLLEDLEQFTELLTEGASLAEDVEAEREARRARAGHVEPRAARAFLRAAQSSADPSARLERDPIARAYFRDLEPSSAGMPDAEVAEVMGWLAEQPKAARAKKRLPAPYAVPITEALRQLSDEDPAAFDRRTEELAFLANVIASGAAVSPPLSNAAAAEAALATVALGAALRCGELPSVGRLAALLAEHPCDLLFRAAVAVQTAHHGPPGWVAEQREVGAVFAAMFAARVQR